MFINLYQPLEQFEIVYLGDFYGIALTNSLLYLGFIYLIIRFVFGFVFYQLNILPKT
jgi:hypothetical protein